MINIDRAYQFVSYIANKVQGVSFLPPGEFNPAIRNAFSQWIEFKLPLFEATQKSTDIFNEIKKTRNLTSTTSTFTLPTDYKHHVSSVIIYYYIDENEEQKTAMSPVEVLSTSQFETRIGSQMEPPSMLVPVAQFVDGVFECAPKTIHRLRMTYLKEPLIPFWNYTVTDGVPAYAPTAGSQTNPNSGVTAGNSTDISAPDYCLTEIAGFVLLYLGYNIKDEVIAQSLTAFQQQ